MTTRAKQSEPRRKTKLTSRLTELRQAQKLGMRDFAKLTNTTAATICQTEHGCTLALDLALRIAQQLKLPVESIWSLPVSKKRTKK